MNQQEARRDVWRSLGAYMTTGEIEGICPQFHDMTDAEQRRYERAFAYVTEQCFRKGRPPQR